jgi:hypothetical protein
MLVSRRNGRPLRVLVVAAPATSLDLACELRLPPDRFDANSAGFCALLVGEQFSNLLRINGFRADLVWLIQCFQQWL